MPVDRSTPREDETNHATTALGDEDRNDAASPAARESARESAGESSREVRPDAALATTRPRDGADREAGTRSPGSRKSSPMRIPAGTRVGRYLILGRLGSGGMGVVYAAFDPQLDRKVAVKFMREPRAGAMASTRLEREGQALARLQHPNVIQVFDVGMHENRLFIAMELVEGPSLRQWLDERTRSVREVISVFTQAGQGLAAAHDAQLIHRDFKPDNVFIRRGGSVCVMDFGLARATQLQDGDALLPDESPSGRSSLDVRLTRAGAVVGTLPYMAPEQFTGEPVDERTDQFSFCVALYEALYETRPFSGKMPDEDEDRWRLREPDKPRRIPARLRRLVLRGLERDRSRRFPSMHALLAELGAERRGRRYAVAALAGLAVVALGVASYAGLSARDSRPCQDAALELDGVWDDERRAAVERAFLATGAPYAADAWTRTRAVLDRYASDWIAMHTESCEATRVRGEQSDAMLSLRMACLERRRRDLDALVGVLDDADQDTMSKAIQAAHALPPLDGCADAEALRLAVAPPADPATAAKVDEVRAKLAESKALVDAGKYELAHALTDPLLASASSLAYRPVEAEALVAAAVVAEKRGDLKGSADLAFRGLVAAQSVGDDAIASAALVALVRADMLLGEYEPGKKWSQLGFAMLERIGGDPRHAASLHVLLAGALDHQSDPAGAVDELQKALTLRLEVSDENDPAIAAIYTSLGTEYSQLSRFDQASAALARGVAIYQATLGKDHPDTARALYGTGIRYEYLGRDREALDYFRRAVEVWQAALGPDHFLVGKGLNAVGTRLLVLGENEEALQVLGQALSILRARVDEAQPDVAFNLDSTGLALANLGRHDEALGYYDRALHAYEAIHGPDHPQVAPSHYTRGMLLLDMGRRDEARAALERAAALWKPSMDGKDPSLSRALAGLGDWYLRGGKPDRALAYYLQALGHREAILGPSHPLLYNALEGMGDAYLALGQTGKSVAAYQRALAITDPEGDPLQAAETRFHLARALWVEGKDRGKALALARSAKQAFRGEADPKVRAEIDAWLAQHGAR